MQFTNIRYSITLKDEQYAYLTDEGRTFPESNASGTSFGWPLWRKPRFPEGAFQLSYTLASS